MPDQDQVQDLLSRVGGLEMALEMALKTLAASKGSEARATIALLRDELVDLFKSAGVPADKDLDIVRLAGPAIDAIEVVFNAVINGID